MTAHLSGTRFHRPIQLAAAIGLAASLMAAALFSYSFLKRLSLTPGKPTEEPAARAAVELVAGSHNQLWMDQDAVQRMGIKTAIAQPAHLVETLRLVGTLTLDAGKLQEVRSRFVGEVVEVGTTGEDAHPILSGDRVAKDQLLAVVWSRDLGEKKSELVEVLSQQHLHNQTLARLKPLYEKGEIPEREYRDAELDVQESEVAVARVLRTLQTWRIPAEEIAAVKAEAERLIAGNAQPSEALTQQWARVEVRAALDGVVLERNVAVGDLVSTEDDLFKVADLSRLRVLAYAYEEDLPKLDRLAPERRRWIISVPADRAWPPQEGTIDRIGHLIDPMQHTALVMGWVDNPQGRLRAGQFITAAVELPPPGNEVAVPAAAILEKGGESLVFVQTSPEPIFTRRSVSVSRQLGQTSCVCSQPAASGPFPVQPLQPGEVVVVSGAVELQQALTDLTAVSVEKRNAP